MTLYFCMKMKVTVLFWLKDKSPYDVASNLLAAARQPTGDLSNTPYKQLTLVCPGHIPPLFVQTSLNQIPRVRIRLPTNRPTTDRPRWIGLNFRFRRPSCVAHPRYATVRGLLPWRARIDATRLDHSPVKLITAPTIPRRVENGTV